MVLVPGQALGGKQGALYLLRDEIIARQAAHEIAAAETAVGEWTTGVPIYRKVLAVPAGPDENTITVAHGITGLDVVVKVYGSLKNVGNDRLVFPTDGAQLSINIDQTNVELTSAADLSAYVGSIVLEYTKA